MATKELSEKNKFLLLKKLKSYIQTIRILIGALIFTVGFAILAYKLEWVSEDFPAYPVLLSIVIAGAILAYYIQIRKTRTAILTSRKIVIKGPIQKKTKQSDEYSTEYSFEVEGHSYDVKAKHYDTFQEGEQVKIELAYPGKELIKIKRLKLN